MKRGKSSSEVCEAIREAIRSGELLPGMHLKQTDWAQRLGVSRVPIREALGMLESEGLLLHEPHQGYSVVTLSESEITQLYLLRRLIDKEIAGNLVWPSTETMEQLRTVYSEAEKALEADDIVHWLACNDRFILGIYALCPLEIIVGEAIKLWRRTETVRAGRIRYEWQHRSPEVIRQSIGRILATIEKRDRTGLKAAFTRLTQVKRTSSTRLVAL